MKKEILLTEVYKPYDLIKPIVKAYNSFKVFCKRAFDCLVILILTSGLFMMYFSYQAYHGKATPFEQVYIVGMNDRLDLLAEAQSQVQAQIEDNGLIPTVDSLRKEVSQLKSKVLEIGKKIK